MLSRSILLYFCYCEYFAISALVNLIIIQVGATERVPPYCTDTNATWVRWLSIFPEHNLTHATWRVSQIVLKEEGDRWA